MIEKNPMRDVINYASSAPAQYKEKPNAEQIKNGVIPLDSLPAAWWNWMWADTNGAIDEARTVIQDYVDEILTLTKKAGVPYVPESADRIFAAVDKIRQTIATNVIPGAVKSSETKGEVGVGSDGTMTSLGLGPCTFNGMTSIDGTAAKTYEDATAAIKGTRAETIAKFTSVVNGLVKPYASAPKGAGTASAGSSACYARGDHVHPYPTWACCSKYACNAGQLGGKTEAQLNVCSAVNATTAETATNACKLNNHTEAQLSVCCAVNSSYACNAGKLNNKTESQLSVANSAKLNNRTESQLNVNSSIYTCMRLEYLFTATEHACIYNGVGCQKCNYVGFLLCYKCNPTFRYYESIAHPQYIYYPVYSDGPALTAGSGTSSCSNYGGLATVICMACLFCYGSCTSWINMPHDFQGQLCSVHFGTERISINVHDGLSSTCRDYPYAEAKVYGVLADMKFTLPE